MSNLNINNQIPPTPLNTQNISNNISPSDIDIQEFERAMSSPSQEKVGEQENNKQFRSEMPKTTNPELKDNLQRTKAEHTNSQFDQLANSGLGNNQSNKVDTKNNSAINNQADNQEKSITSEATKLSPDKFVSKLFNSSLAQTNERNINMQNTQAPSNMGGLADKLVDNTIIANSKTGNEIHTKLNNDSLANTEIKLTRGLDTQASLSPNTNNTNSIQSSVVGQDSLKQVPSNTKDTIMSNLNINNQAPTNTQNIANNISPKNNDLQEFERAMSSPSQEKVGEQRNDKQVQSEMPKASSSELKDNSQSIKSERAMPSPNQEKVGEQKNDKQAQSEMPKANNTELKDNSQSIKSERTMSSPNQEKVGEQKNDKQAQSEMPKTSSPELKGNSQSIKAENSNSQLDQLANKAFIDKQSNKVDTKNNAEVNKQQDNQESNIDNEAIKLSPDKFLSSLFNVNLTQSSDKNINIQNSQTTNNMNELVDKLVDRILVADTKNGNEVRISLNNGALADTEIKLTRGLDGQLTVNLITNNANSFQSLVAAQDSLKQALANTNENVRVEVSNSSNEQDEANDTNKRSQNYIEYQDQE